VSVAPPPQSDQATRLRALVRDATASDRPPHPIPLEPAADRQRPLEDWGRPRQAPPALPNGAAPRFTGGAAVIAIASGKGGVGKTNIAVSLAASIAKQGRRTILLDGDLGLANADLLCNVPVRKHLGHVLAGERTVRDILIEAPGGFRLAPGGAGVAHALLATAEERRADLLSRLRGLEEEADVLLIDCGAGVGPVVRTFTRAADVALVVATPEPTSIADAYALVKTLLASQASRGGPSVRLVVNQARSGDEAVQVHARIGSVARRFLGADLPLAGWVPADPNVGAAVRARACVVLRSPRSPASKALTTLGKRLSDEVAPLESARSRREGLVARFFGRAKWSG